MNEAVMLSALGIVASCVAGLLWVIKFMFNKLVPLIESGNKLIKQNTYTTKNADKYLKERNGRDTEKHAELLKATKAIPNTMQEIADAQSKAILTAVEVKEQHVEHQHIDRQTGDKK
jgi:hypothetical protein